MAEKKTILFIDDNPLDRTLIERILSKNGFLVLLAPEVKSGLSLAEERKPDLILLDILLPGISGIEACKMLKKNPLTKQIPVFFFTSIDTPKEFMDYKSYGAQNYLRKTMPSDELIAEIKTALKVR